MKVFALLAITVLATAASASARGTPQGPVKQEWTCILAESTWHCVPHGEEVAAIAGRPASLPSVNFACDAPGAGWLRGL